MLSELWNNKVVWPPNRRDLFMDCYQHVSEALRVIYKDLTRSSKHPVGGQAYLSLENNEEPYLSGIKYNAMPPMKRFRDMEQLSGGEKTVASLALLFAIHRYDVLIHVHATNNISSPGRPFFQLSPSAILRFR